MADLETLRKIQAQIEDNVHKQVAVPKQILLDLITEIRALRKVALETENYLIWSYDEHSDSEKENCLNMYEAIQAWRKGSDQKTDG
jgi:hypothetical protein